MAKTLDRLRGFWTGIGQALRRLKAHNEEFGRARLKARPGYEAGDAYDRVQKARKRRAEEESAEGAEKSL